MRTTSTNLTPMRTLRLAAAAAFAAALPAASLAQADLPIDRITLAPGFAIEVVARVDTARAMTWGDKGTLFVGSFSLGNVYAIKDAGGKREVKTVLKGLNMPTGLAFHEHIAGLRRAVRACDGGIEHRADGPEVKGAGELVREHNEVRTENGEVLFRGMPGQSCQEGG